MREVEAWMREVDVDSFERIHADDDKAVRSIMRSCLEVGFM